MSETRYRLYGSNGSPYSVKMRAVLRYRRIPHDWVRLSLRNQAIVQKVKPPVIPVLEYPDGALRNDSTPLIYDLETRHVERRIVPEDPGHAFLAHVIEDMADEWGTKMMFHYRWHGAADRDFVGKWLARERMGPAGAEAIAAAATAFVSRQVGRMELVGVQAENRPVLSESYRRLLAILDRHLEGGEYFFGGLPSLAEFGLYGQLWQLATDPTPSAIMRETAPRVFSWLFRLDDASGEEGGAWQEPTAPLSRVVDDLLAHVGTFYFPFLLANEAALKSGAERLSVEILGHAFTQAPFRYQGKCLQWLREEYAALPDTARKGVERTLDAAGCLAALRG